MSDISGETVSKKQATSAVARVGARFGHTKQRNAARVEATDNITVCLDTLATIGKTMKNNNFMPCDVYNVDEITITQRPEVKHALADVAISPQRRLGEKLTT